LSRSAATEANPNNNGNAANAPGQAKAQENCSENVFKQTDKEVEAGGGPKEGFLGPTNCDHNFNEE